MNFAGQNPAVRALIYRPDEDESTWKNPVFRPGIDDATFKTIGPYNPSEDKSEVIQLAEWKENPRGLVGHYTRPPHKDDRLVGHYTRPPHKYDRFIFVPEEPDERFIFVPEKVDPRLSEFEPFDIVKGEGGSPYEEWKFPRPEIPQPTPPAPQARMAGLSEAIAAIVTALELNG